jgi:plastocyanin
MKVIKMKRIVFAGIVIAAAAACGKETKTETPATSSATTEQNAPSAGGRIIEVGAYSDSAGNYFKPSEIEAHPGDIVRFTLMSGVHNINFVADSNPGKSGLPPASDMLQLPGQTYDLKVTLAKGKYYFHCDPHAALGMKGRLEVED